MPLCKDNVVLTLFFYKIVNKKQTMTKLAENGRKGFSALCAMDIEATGQKQA